MGINQDHAIGFNKEVVIQPELAADTYPAFTIPDAGNTGAAEVPTRLAALETNFNPAQAREKRNDAGATRDYHELISGMKTVDWSIKCYITVPAQGSATLPDWGPLMHAAMGTQTIGGTSYTYALSHAQSACPALTISELMNDVYSMAVYGAVVDEMKISWAQGEIPALEFSGPASNWATTGTTTVNDGSPSGTSITVADGTQLSANSVIKIGSDDSTSDRGHKVASISGNVVTLTESVTGVSNSDVIIPFQDAGITTTTASLLSGIQGQLDIGSDTDVPILSFEATVKQNVDLRTEAGKDAAQEVILGRRDITGTISILAAKDQILKLRDREQFTTAAWTVRIGGSTSGDEKMTLTFGKVEFGFEAVSVPLDGPAVINLPFTAIATTATATDALSIVLATV